MNDIELIGRNILNIKTKNVVTTESYLNGETTYTWDSKKLKRVLYLTFCRFNENTMKSEDRQFITYSIPVAFIEKFQGKSHKFLMGDNKSYKVVYISLDKVIGSPENTANETQRMWCLRSIEVL